MVLLLILIVFYIVITGLDISVYGWYKYSDICIKDYRLNIFDSNIISVKDHGVSYISVNPLPFSLAKWHVAGYNGERDYQVLRFSPLHYKIEKMHADLISKKS